jgi:hypothetical protein
MAPNSKNKMKLITITVCVDYSDILELCIQKNRKSLENWFVITSSNDTKTKDLCKKYSINCFVTDVFYDKGCIFNKAAAMNELLYVLQNNKTLDYFEWVLLLDADIILNDSIDKIISHYNVNKLHHSIVQPIPKNYNIEDLFYSCQRKIFNSQNDFINNNGYLENIDFIGYFQLFHKSKILNDLQNNQNIFPEFPTACRYDDAFKYKYWPDRHTYAEINSIVYHLGPIATNWEGRKTEVWRI